VVRARLRLSLMLDVLEVVSVHMKVEVREDGFI
jgi:hypothetical protein